MSTPAIYIADTETVLFTLHDVCERCGVQVQTIVAMVEHGIIAPAVESRGDNWQFTIDALLRLNRAQRLQQDLEINLSGLALSLELLDQIEALQQEIASLKQQLRTLHRE